MNERFAESREFDMSRWMLACLVGMFIARSLSALLRRHHVVDSGWVPFIVGIIGSVVMVALYRLVRPAHPPQTSSPRIRLAIVCTTFALGTIAIDHLVGALFGR